MAVRAWIAKRSPNIEAAHGTSAIVMKAEPTFRRERRELAAERGSLGRPRAVMDLELGVAPPKIRDHRHDRGNADAAGDQQVPLCRCAEREVVARERDLDQVAGADALVQVARPAAAFGLAQHRDAIASALGGIVPQ